MPPAIPSQCCVQCGMQRCMQYYTDSVSMQGAQRALLLHGVFWFTSTVVGHLVGAMVPVHALKAVRTAPLGNRALERSAACCTVYSAACHAGCTAVCCTACNAMCIAACIAQCSHMQRCIQCPNGVVLYQGCSVWDLVVSAHLLVRLCAHPLCVQEALFHVTTEYREALQAQDSLNSRLQALEAGALLAIGALSCCGGSRA